MKSYRITEWDSLYEVNDKGNPYHPGQTKRKGPLEYIRKRCDGANMTEAFRAMMTLSDSVNISPAAVYGVWTKCLELVGYQPSELRDSGKIRDRRGIPRNSRDISGATGFPLKEVEQALSILTHPSVGWLTVETLTEQEELENSREIPGNPGKLRDAFFNPIQLRYGIEDNTDAVPPSLSFEDWKKRLKEEKNVNAVFMDMLTTLFPDKTPPEFPRLGKTVKRYGDHEFLASEIWTMAARPVTGNVLDYLDKKKSQRGKKDAKTKPDYENGF